MQSLKPEFLWILFCPHLLHFLVAIIKMLVLERDCELGLAKS